MTKKTSITISVPYDITEDEIKEIRQLFAQDPLSHTYRLNILISGNKSMQDVLSRVLIEKIRNIAKGDTPMI